MRINGKQVEYEPVTLLKYLQQQGYNPGQVVVERAREIVTKERFGSIVLREDDDINILQFMGGG